MLAQHALDAVEGAADDREVFGRDAIPFELVAGHFQEAGIVQIVGVQLRRDRCASNGGRQVRQERRVGITGSQITHAARQGHWCGSGHRGAVTNTSASSAIGDDDATILEEPVGGGDRGGTHPQRSSQRSHGRQVIPSRQVAVGDGCLDGTGDVDGRVSLDVSLYCHC